MYTSALTKELPKLIVVKACQLILVLNRRNSRLEEGTV